MTAPRSARLELRVTPVQKEAIVQSAARSGKSLTEYALGVLLDAAVRDVAGDGAVPASLGWMRGTAVIRGDIEGPTESEGWEPGAWPT